MKNKVDTCLNSKMFIVQKKYVSKFKTTLFDRQVVDLLNRFEQGCSHEKAPKNMT